MNIHEYQAKLLLKNYSVPIPRGDVAVTWSQAEQVLEKLGGDAWVVKAQIHAGARGKAGGVKVARGKAEVEAFCRERLGKRLVTHQTDSDGLPVDVLLIEEASAIKHEFYVSLVLDREAECLMFIASAAGGMDIEAVAEESPEKIVRVPVPPAAGYQPYQGRLIAAALGLAKEQESQLQGILRGVYDLCVAKDASQIEINPLIENAAGQLIALDAKINFDDNAVPSHADISALRDIVQENPKEVEARQNDLNYVALDGNIGCMVNGAGLAMATMDLVKLKGGQPANFLDVGGGTNKDKVKEAFMLLMFDGAVKAVLVNIFGGIVQCDVIAHGILSALEGMDLHIPVVVRLEGSNAELGREILKHSGLPLIAADDLNSAAEQVVALAGAGA